MRFFLESTTYYFAKFPVDVDKYIFDKKIDYCIVRTSDLEWYCTNNRFSLDIATTTLCDLIKIELKKRKQNSCR